MFVIDDKDAKNKKKLSELASEAVHLEEDYHQVTRQAPDTIKEVCSLSEVPKDWREAYLYHSDDEDITPMDFFLGAFK